MRRPNLPQSHSKKQGYPTGRLVFWGILLAVGAVIYLLSLGEESDDLGGPPSGSTADSNIEREIESGAVSRVYETVEGNPSVIWTEAPNFVDATLILAGTVDPVVSTWDLSVTLFYQPTDSREQWCGIVGKPWLSIVEPPPPFSSYKSSNTSMWCEVTYRQEDNRVSGNEKFRETRTPRTVEVTFPFRTANVWAIKGKTFRIHSVQHRFDRPGIHAVTLWAGPELLAVHVVERPDADGGQP